MGDQTRLALFFVGVPVVVVGCGVLIGLIGRWVTGRG